MSDDARRTAAATLPDRIAFLGLGLIGGSIALALREAGYGGELVAWTPEGRGPAEAQRRRMIDAAAHTPEAALDGAGLVVLAGPALAIVDNLGLLAGPWSARLERGATITDVGSTKGLIVENASAYGLRFVGGHPMAGRETTGVGAATAELFIDRPWVIVAADGAAAADVTRVEGLARAPGARPIAMPASEHDRAVAAISHLPLVLSAALVEAVAGRPGAAAAWPVARELAASGWRDMSRLAKGDPEMGAGMLSTNAGNVVEGLRALRVVLDEWIDRLDPGMPGGGDPIWLRTQLEQVRSALEAGRE